MILSAIFSRRGFRYMFMPELVSRINTLVLGGFHYIPFFIASVYQIVRLLPANHPYANPVNIGRFGIRHVVAEAANHLVIDRKNIDKIFLFVLVLLGLALLFVQICLIVVSLCFQPVFAFPTNWTGFFVVPAADRPQDIAFIMLDMVFGVPYPTNGPGVGVGPGFFESCVGIATPCQDADGNAIGDVNPAGLTIGAGNLATQGMLASGAWTAFPFPVHLGLHRLFMIYSQGLLVIAVGISSYFIATILAETAQSGTPFGRRFNKMWAPIRIVMAFGLLVPLQVGLNSSQYIVLYAAKFGSAFATNGWRYFNTRLNQNYLSTSNDLVAYPTLPEVGQISQFLFIARTCRWAYRHALGAPGSGPNASPDIRAYLVLQQTKTPNFMEVLPGTTLAAAQGALEPLTTTLVVRYGERDPIKYPKEQGNVKPYCGEMQFKLSDPRIGGASEPGPRIIQEFFWDTARDMWHHAGGRNYFQGGAVGAAGDRAEKLSSVEFNITPVLGTPYPDVAYVAAVNRNVYLGFQTEVTNAVNAQRLSGRWAGLWTPGDPVFRKGWAAAGIWYNRVAEMNMPIHVSVRALPEGSLFPSLLEELKAYKAKYNQETSSRDLFQPVLSNVDDTSTLISAAHGQKIAMTMFVAHRVWLGGTGSTETRGMGNPFYDFITALLGTNGLYDLRNNPTTHPLAQLVSVGRSLIESAMTALGYGFWSSLGGIAAGLAGSVPGGKLGSVFGSFFFTMAMISLTTGFILAYVVPFLPFIYFFFAVGGWVKGIFEAMVGAPLWALAHIRIDAQGLPGNAALNGYFLIFEIFLRPILCLFGLLAAISIYSALVEALNLVFDLVIHNVGGFDVSAEMALAPSFLNSMRGPIDEFFFTVIYAIIVYMLGMSSFKLIDTIPNNILRWMGQSVATFGDMREDPAQGLVGKAGIGAQQVTAKVGGALGGFANIGSRLGGK